MDAKQCRTLTIEIPLPMPTHNRINQMQHWEKKDMRHLLHLFVSLSITYGSDWPTATDYQGKQCSTELLRLKYLQMIRPNKSRKSDIAKLKAQLKQR